jgi:hypothetical protein
MRIAIQERLDGKAVDWLEHVSDEQYEASEDQCPPLAGFFSTISAHGSNRLHGRFSSKPFACSYVSFNSSGIGDRLAPRLTCTTRTTFASSSTVKKMRFT